MTKPLRAIPAPERVGDRIVTEIVGTYGSATVSAMKGNEIHVSAERPGFPGAPANLSRSEAKSLSLALEAAIAFAEGNKC